MILTVALNTGIDRILLIPHYRWGETIRAQDEVYGMGSKATSAAWVLGELGIACRAIGFAAGETGQRMEAMLNQRGVHTDFTWVDGDTRNNLILVSSAGEGHTSFAVSSLRVSQKHISAFRALYEEALKEADCVLIGGSVPKGVPVEIYTDLVRQARAAGIPVVFDASGRELRAGLEGRPTLIKPNRDELEDLLGVRVESVEQVYQAACQLCDQFGCIVVATLGAMGALAVTVEQAYFIEPPHVEVKSAAGAGDAIIGGLSHALGAKLPLEEGLRLGFAAAASTLMQLATADTRREDVMALLPQVKIRSYPA